MAKDYREIRPEFTVDRFTDGQAPTANINSFQRLTNFIPKRGRIETRLGIGEFTHTPDTSFGDPDVWEPQTPGQTFPPSTASDFAVIQAIFPFNSEALIGHNVLNGVLVYSALNSPSKSGTCTTYTAEKIEGAASIIMTNDTAVNTAAGNGAATYGMRTLNVFPWWMPGDSGEITKKFLLTYWLYPFEADAAANAEWHFTFGNDVDVNKLAMGVRHFDTDLQCWWTDSGGGTVANPALPGIMAENQWQFIALWYDADTGYEGIYHYNAATLTETYTATDSGPAAMDHFYHHSTSNTINANYLWNGVDGSPANESAAYHGLMDYVTMWSRPMHLNNSSNITLVRLIRNMSWLL